MMLTHVALWLAAASVAQWAPTQFLKGGLHWLLLCLIIWAPCSASTHLSMRYNALECLCWWADIVPPRIALSEIIKRLHTEEVAAQQQQRQGAQQQEQKPPVPQQQAAEPAAALVKPEPAHPPPQQPPDQAPPAGERAYDASFAQHALPYRCRQQQARTPDDPADGARQIGSGHMPSLHCSAVVCGCVIVLLQVPSHVSRVQGVQWRLQCRCPTAARLCRIRMGPPCRSTFSIRLYMPCRVACSRRPNCDVVQRCADQQLVSKRVGAADDAYVAIMFAYREIYR